MNVFLLLFKLKINSAGRKLLETMTKNNNKNESNLIYSHSKTSRELGGLDCWQ